MNFEQKNGGEHCTADNSPQDVFHCDADENEFAGFILKKLPLVSAVAGVSPDAERNRRNWFRPVRLG